MVFTDYLCAALTLAVVVITSISVEEVTSTAVVNFYFCRCCCCCLLPLQEGPLHAVDVVTVVVAVVAVSIFSPVFFLQYLIWPWCGELPVSSLDKTGFRLFYFRIMPASHAHKSVFTNLN